jgi:ABC-type uncharacterized transport system substrate-binding protein
VAAIAPALSLPGGPTPPGRSPSPVVSPPPRHAPRGHRLAFWFASLTLLLTLAPAAARAGGPTVAIITSKEIKPYQEAVEGFRKQVMAAVPNAEITIYYLDGDPAQGATIASTLAATSCKLVNVVGTEAYKALAPRLQDIPLVISMVYDPEAEFDITTTRRSQTFGAPLRVPMSKQLEILHSFCPKIRRVSFVYTKKSSIPQAEVAGAAPAGIELVGIPIDDLGQLEKALDTARSRSDAFLMVMDPAIYTKTTIQSLLLTFMRAKIPVVSFSPNFAKAGALLSISTGYRDSGSTAGRIAAEILTGMPIPSHFPPTPKPRMDWNSRAAELLGIELSPENRARCTDIYGL